jgi:hypothetical protein
MSSPFEEEGPKPTGPVEPAACGIVTLRAELTQ